MAMDPVCDNGGHRNTRPRRHQAVSSWGEQGGLWRRMHVLPGTMLSLGMPGGQLGSLDTYMTGTA